MQAKSTRERETTRDGNTRHVDTQTYRHKDTPMHRDRQDTDTDRCRAREGGRHGLTSKTHTSAHTDTQRQRQ